MWEEMAEGGFNELENVDKEVLLVEAFLGLLDAYRELSRHKKTAINWLRSLCGFSTETSVWFILWESEGTQRFTDILKAAGCSRSKLSDVLRDLLNEGMVKMVEGRYQAVSPAWFGSLLRTKEAKI
jgi:hypothetical protein